MAILIVAPDRDTSDLSRRLRALAPDLDVRMFPDIGESAEIDFAVLWKHPPGLLASLPALKAVTSLGAGVEHLLADPDLPADLPVGRLVGPHLAADMAAYVVGQVVSHWKRLDQFRNDQQSRQWRPWAPEARPLVGLLGTGAMGIRTAAAFQSLEIAVAGYSRTGRERSGITMVSELAELAGRADYLVCLLPLTDLTRGLLNAELFSFMKPESTLINVGRGEHLVDDDLIAALDAGRPGLAILDVFREEPLPVDHPFWTHPKVRITPHCASITQEQEAARLIVESYQRIQAGQPPVGKVDRELGY